MKNNSLLIVPSIMLWLDGENIIFDRKFYDGMLMYRDLWPGPVHCIMRLSHDSLPVFGVVRKKQEEIPFQVTLLSAKEKINAGHLKAAALLLASGDSHDQFHLSRLCKANNIKCVYSIEYIPETRYQIVNLETSNIFVRLRRRLYVWQGERKRRAAFLLANGLQANGSAAYHYYNTCSKRMLYFDTRIRRGDVIPEQHLHERLITLSEDRPLHLAFSGRLVRMKGADLLVPLAVLLREDQVHFRMSIYGAGDLESAMKKQIQEHQLSSQVKMMGSVNFYDQLLPELQAGVDLFVVLHQQSDPSCTYLETFSCGIPIVGFNNKAFLGFCQEAAVGWGREMDDLQGIADIINGLDRDRRAIQEMSMHCVVFSRQHDFEQTYQKRVDHLRSFLDA